MYKYFYFLFFFFEGLDLPTLHEMASAEAWCLKISSLLNQAHIYPQNSVTVKVLPHYKGPSRCQSTGTESTRGSIWHFGKLGWQMVLHLLLLLFFFFFTAIFSFFFLTELHFTKLASIWVTVLFYTNISLLSNK